MIKLLNFITPIIIFTVISINAISYPLDKDSPVVTIPREVYPGNAFIIRSYSKTRPVISFQGKLLPTYSKDNYFQAVDYVRIDSKAGMIPIYLGQAHDKIIKYLKVINKNFPVKHIKLKSDNVFLSPEDEKRAEREEKILKSIWNKITPRPLWTGKFIKPVDSIITSEFGVKRIINNRKESRHRGTDYRGTAGTPVKSINSGVVVLSDNQFYGGNTVVIDHGMGLYSVYLHFSRFMVSKGESVKKGQIVGLVGSTGRASGPHLHLSVKLYGESINPESLFNLDL